MVVVLSLEQLKVPPLLLVDCGHERLVCCRRHCLRFTTRTIDIDICSKTCYSSTAEVESERGGGGACRFGNFCSEASTRSTGLTKALFILGTI